MEQTARLLGNQKYAIRRGLEKINNCQNCVSLLLRTECSSPNSQGIIEKLMFGLQTQYSDDGNSIFLMSGFPRIFHINEIFVKRS